MDAGGCDSENHHDSDEEGETPCGSAPHKKELTAAASATAKKERRVCQKCNVTPSVFVWRTEYCCWGCYRKLFEKRFKTSLMRARKNKHERIHLLVGLSGGPSSRALLHCVAQCTMGRGTKALYQVDVLHVDQSLMLGLSQAEGGAARSAEERREGIRSRS